MEIHKSTDLNRTQLQQVTLVRNLLMIECLTYLKTCATCGIVSSYIYGDVKSISFDLHVNFMYMQLNASEPVRSEDLTSSIEFIFILFIGLE